MTPITKLGPEERAATIERLKSEDVDVVVIGGGVTGVGAALDAASRGLSVALVERDDFASGTSSKSTKLAHGGLRYLQQLNFRLVAEALTERNLMLEELCPHLVHPVPILFPFNKRVWERAFIGSGVVLYDTIATGKRGVPLHKHYSKTKALEIAPELRDDAFVGAVRYYDGQLDDARHTMAIGRTAAHHGAHVLTHAPATGLELDDAGAVAGVKVKDARSGEEFTIATTRVINATGPWTDEIQGMAGTSKVKVRPSKGIHVLVPRERLDMEVGLITQTAKSVLFVLPWGAHWLIGTTDTDWEEDVDDVVATKKDVDYVLNELNKWIRNPVTPDEITGVFAGLRPLVAPAGEGETTAISREHAVMESAPGLFSISGGKYTTYRVMAKDVVDEAVKGLDREVPPSPTKHLPLLGAVGYEALKREREQLAAKHGIHVDWFDHLLGRQGDLIDEVLELMEERPELAEPLEGAELYLAAEVVYAVTHEGAIDLDDVLDRRLRVRIQVLDRGHVAAEPAAKLMAAELGWSEEKTQAEIDRYRAMIDADLQAEQTVDDTDAARVRREVREAAGV